MWCSCGGVTSSKRLTPLLCARTGRLVTPSPSHSTTDSPHSAIFLSPLAVGGQTAVGPADWFTGTVYIHGIRNPDEQSTVGCAHVRFTPGARTAWHTHPKGQTLYVTDGIGCVARRDGTVQEIRPGDVVYIEPNEEHWHGATSHRFMAHIALQEADDEGQVVTWLDHVTDDEYGA